MTRADERVWWFSASVESCSPSVRTSSTSWSRSWSDWKVVVHHHLSRWLYQKKISVYSFCAPSPQPHSSRWWNGCGWIMSTKCVAVSWSSNKFCIFSVFHCTWLHHKLLFATVLYLSIRGIWHVHRSICYCVWWDDRGDKNAQVIFDSIDSVDWI